MTTIATADAATAQKYKGKVVAFREDNGYDDSDFFALVETEVGSFEWIMTGSTRFGGGWVATPNATEEVKARYAEWYAAKKAVVDAAQAAYDKKFVGVGSEVKVVGGKKYKGKSGTVVWFGEDKFKYSKISKSYRVAVMPSDGSDKFYVPASYVQVSTPEGWVEPINAIELLTSPKSIKTSPAAYVFSSYPAPK